MRYRLRTLLILLAIVPPVLAPLLVWGWRQYIAWRDTAVAEMERGNGYLGAYLDDHQRSRVEVIEVRPGEAAEAGGLMSGDVITAVNNRPCLDCEDFDAVFEQASAGTTLVVTVSRGNVQRTLQITLRERVPPAVEP